MKLTHKITAIVVATVLGVFALAGCSGGVTSVISSSNVVSENQAYNYSYIPAGHEGRYEALGAAGCYGCHGSSDESDPFLTGVKAIPDSHYKDQDRTTRELDSDHMECLSCHSEMTATASDSEA